MINETTTRRRGNISGDHARPRVFYSAPPPNSALSQATPALAESLQRVRLHRVGGFTFAELLVTVGVLVLLVLLSTQLLNSAATITTLGHKQMSADSQARQLLDRMAIDFTQMVKRSDVDYYLKPASTKVNNSDQIAFYSTVNGYYPTGPTTTQKSSLSLIAYRVNSGSRLERMGKGLVWNGVSSGTLAPIVFLPLTISANWPAATNGNADTDYDEIGPHIFRFEYYYLLNNGTLSATPWYTTTSVRGMQDVAAIVVDIATVDPKSRVLLSNSDITSLAQSLTDYSGQAPGALLANWRETIDGNTGLPRPVLPGIRLYERYLYLSPPTLLTP
jgi:type II secretory pathway component PulJ